MADEDDPLAEPLDIGQVVRGQETVVPDSRLVSSTNWRVRSLATTSSPTVGSSR